MHSKISKYSVEFFNQQEFHSLKREIFTNNLYYFKTKNPTPFIIDAGAYVGISTLYFKQLYLNSQILAFEPNPFAIEKLKNNMFNNGIKNVDIKNSAVWTSEEIKEMYIDDTGQQRFSVASFSKNGWNGEVKSRAIKVKTEKLDKYLNQNTDLLKLDVEGSEQQILKNIVKYFDNIKNIILEYHPVNNQDVDKIIKILSKKYSVEIFDEGEKIDNKIPRDKLLTIKAIYKH